MIDNDLIYTIQWYAYYYKTEVTLLLLVYMLPIIVTIVGVKRWIRNRYLHMS